MSSAPSVPSKAHGACADKHTTRGGGEAPAPGSLPGGKRGEDVTFAVRRLLATGTDRSEKPHHRDRQEREATSVAPEPSRQFDIFFNKKMSTSVKAERSSGLGQTDRQDPLCSLFSQLLLGDSGFYLHKTAT